MFCMMTESLNLNEIENWKGSPEERSVGNEVKKSGREKINSKNRKYYEGNTSR
jgi:uncharacterized phage-associated protein